MLLQKYECKWTLKDILLNVMQNAHEVAEHIIYIFTLLFSIRGAIQKFGEFECHARTVCGMAFRR
jgi:hypothetical protein